MITEDLLDIAKNKFHLLIKNNKIYKFLSSLSIVINVILLIFIIIK